MIEEPGISNVSGSDLAQAGMQQAADHAEQEAPGWNDKALAAVLRFLNESALANGEFMAEEFRLWAYQKAHLVRPPSERAWGSVVKSAIGAGYIHKVRIGNVRNPRAHGSHAAVYRRGAAHG